MYINVKYLPAGNIFQLFKLIIGCNLRALAMVFIFTVSGRALDYIISWIIYILKYLTFHCFRFIRSKKDLSLPHNENDPSKRAQRARELETIRGLYQLEQKTYGFTLEEQRGIDLVDVPPLVSPVS